MALICEGDEPTDIRNLTYSELLQEVFDHSLRSHLFKVCKLANALKAHGVKKGDAVCIYMPMVAEACIAMLACMFTLRECDY